MKQIKYFLLGITSILFVIPICNKLLELAELWIESLKINPQRKILEANKDTTILREFIKPSYPVYDICDDDDFEDLDEDE